MTESLTKARLSHATAWSILAVIATSLGCSSNQPENSSTISKSDTEPMSSQIENELPTAVKQVAIRIDTMMCIDGCFNGVKELLEKRPNIQSVGLAPQKEEGKIDNSTIIITYRGELDRQQIERLILGAGFERVEFQEPAS